MLSDNLGEVIVSILAVIGLTITFFLTAVGKSKTVRPKNTRDNGDSNDHFSAGGK